MSLGSLPPEPIRSGEPAAVGLATPVAAADVATAVASGMLPAGKPRSTFRRGPDPRA
jgi:hypothetical protein